MNGENRQTFVYGVSYGTYVASRYMAVSHAHQVGNTPQAHAVILDGVVCTKEFPGVAPRTVFEEFVSKQI